MSENQARPDVPGADEPHRLLADGLAEEPLASPERPGRRTAAARRPGRARAACVRAGSWRRRRCPRPAFRFSAETSLTTSPLSTVPLLQAGSSRVAETTYLGMALSRSAHSPAAGGPASGEPLVAASPEQQRLRAQRLGERDLAPLLEVLAAEWPNQPPRAEALLAVRVLDDAVERDVGADHDRSHFVLPHRRCRMPAKQTPRHPELGARRRPVRARAASRPDDEAAPGSDSAGRWRRYGDAGDRRPDREGAGRR